MRRTSILTALLISLTPAPAVADIMIQETCLGPTCTLTIGTKGQGLGKVIKVPPPETDEQAQLQEQRARKWEAFCKPEAKKDRFGVERYLYAHPGCEFGRDE